MKTILLFLLTSAFAQAQYLESRGYRPVEITAQTSADRNVWVSRAFALKHLYGEDVVLELNLANFGLEKEIWLYDAAQTMGYARSSQARFVNTAGELFSSDVTALWVTDLPYHRERVLVKIPSIVRNYPAVFDVYVKMGGYQFENLGITLRK